jgi:hypothetical protein
MTWSIFIAEVSGSFGITGNVLAPPPNRYLVPWACSDTPDYFL